MPSKEHKRPLYLAANMAELQKMSEVKQLATSNARILVKSADKMFGEAEKYFEQGDEERAFVLYMKFFNVVKQVKTNADYKKNKAYYDNLIGQKNQVRAIENAEKLADSLKERYDFREAEAVAQKFAALDTSGSKSEKVEEAEESTKEEKVEKKTEETPETNGESSKESIPQASITPTALCSLLRDPKAQLILMDARPRVDFAESHINRPPCISVPQEILPPGTTVTHIESQLPEESLALWKQRGNVDHIILIDWNSRFESLTIGTTLRTLKDALFKYDSTVIIKSEPLVLEGGYEQWLIYYPMYTTNAQVSRPSPANHVSYITSLDFDYPDFDEKPPEPETSVDKESSSDSLADSLAEFVKGDAATATFPSGSTPRFDRSLKPRGPSGSLTDMLSKPSTMNNARSINMAQENRSGEGISMVSNALYPSIAAGKRPEKNTNIYNDLQRPGSSSDTSLVKNDPNTSKGTNVSQRPAPPPAASVTSRQEEEERAKLQELEEKRRKEEKALADLMRKKRHVEEQMKESERKALEERELQEAKDKEDRERQRLAEAEKQRLAEIERLRRERKRRELEEQAEKEKQDNLSKEKALADARQRARLEEEEKETARTKAEQHAETLRQELDEKTRQEALAADKQKQDDDLARLKKLEEEQAAADLLKQEVERKKKEAEGKARKDEELRREKERLDKELAEIARKEEVAQKAKLAEEEKRKQAEEERRRVAEEERKTLEEEQKRIAEKEKKIEAKRKAEERRLAAEKEHASAPAKQDSSHQAQENKMVPSLSLPTGWEKRLDRVTNRYYYIDHTRGINQWEPPHMTMMVQPPSEGKGSYTTRLKEEPAVSSRGLTRAHSSPDIMKQLADEARAASKPVYDRGAKPAGRQPEPQPTKAVVRQILRRDLNPVFGNVGPALTGLRNLGNTCYMNSTVQCLNNTSPLVSYFLNDTYHEDINRNSAQGMNGEVVDDFAVVIKALWSGQYRCITPRDLKATVAQYNPIFAGYQQQDSQEFLLFLMDGLHEGLNEVKSKPQIPDQDNDRLPVNKAAEISWENHKLLNRSIIVELFQGQLKSTLTCRTCQKKSVTFEVFMFISLPIPASSRCTLRDCFRAFLQPEEMTGSSKWKCPQCRVFRDAEKKMDIWKLPHILLIHIKRFERDGMWTQKKTTYIDFPVGDLDLGEFMIGPKHRSRYNLYGVSNHYGTMEGGHYTAFCRNPCTSKWYKFDDHEVFEMSKSDVKTSAAYVLYYTSIELKAPLFKPQL